MSPAATASRKKKDPREPQQQAEIELEENDPRRRFAAEFIGTFFLTLSAAGVVVVGRAVHHPLGTAAEATAPALVIASMVYAVSDVSGAHFNPVVTLAFAMRSAFPWKRVPAYWAAQCIGALAAAAGLRAVFGNVASVGSTIPLRSTATVFVTEVVLTCLLMTVILGVGSRLGALGPHAAIPVGGAILACGLLGTFISGPSMNPARSLGPAIVSLDFHGLWIYLAGPAAGAAAAVGLTWLVHGREHASEKEAARGAEARSS